MAQANKKERYSPGPWLAQPSLGKASAFHIVAAASKDNRSTVVAHIPRSTVQPMAANARLIAAAPSMHQVLLDMDGWLANTGHDEDHPWRQTLRTAITGAGWQS